MSETTPRTFPAGCKIIDIRPGTGYCDRFVYATLVGPDGDLIIAATLEYINQQFIGAIIQGETGS